MLDYNLCDDFWPRSMPKAPNALMHLRHEVRMQNFLQDSSGFSVGFGSFRKLRVPYFGVPIRILLFRALYLGPLFSETPIWGPVSFGIPLNGRHRPKNTRHLDLSEAKSRGRVTETLPSCLSLGV